MTYALNFFTSADNRKQAIFLGRTSVRCFREQTVLMASKKQRPGDTGLRDLLLPLYFHARRKLDEGTLRNLSTLSLRCHKNLLSLLL